MNYSNAIDRYVELLKVGNLGLRQRKWGRDGNYFTGHIYFRSFRSNQYKDHLSGVVNTRGVVSITNISGGQRESRGSFQ